MSLAEFIHDNSSQIINEWENFARGLIPSQGSTTPLALRDHISEILVFIVTDMQSSQTGAEQVMKSRGDGPKNGGLKPNAAETHAALRLAGGFNIDQMVSEYRALRASVIKLWRASKSPEDDSGLLDLTRFNEAIDQQLTESIRYYSKNLDVSRNLFLGILTHDMRNPLGAVLMSAGLIPKIGILNERQNVLISQICESGGRINEIVSHLLDITSVRLGSGLPIIKSQTDMGIIGRNLVDEMRALHPVRKFILEISGDMEGYWDKSRIAQVFSNLLGNAVQYGFSEAAITVHLTGSADEVILTVHNEGRPILADKIGGVFDSLVRVTEGNAELQASETTNLGLGLYITKEIITAHGGTIDVRSSAKSGTIFTAYFPRI